MPVFSDIESRTVNKDWPRVRVFNSLTTVVTSGVTKIMTFDSTVHDRWGMHNPLAMAERFTVKVPGFYLVHAYLGYTQNITGIRTSALVHLDSGSTNVALLATLNVQTNQVGDHVFYTTALSGFANVGDFFRVQTFQNSGGNLSVLAATSVDFRNQAFAAQWIGE